MSSNVQVTVTVDGNVVFSCQAANVVDAISAVLGQLQLGLSHFQGQKQSVAPVVVQPMPPPVVNG